jgi:hypothetical protein
VEDEEQRVLQQQTNSYCCENHIQLAYCFLAEATISLVLESIFFLFDTNCRCKKIVQDTDDPVFFEFRSKIPFSHSLSVSLSLSLSLVPLLRLFSVSLSASVLGIHHSHFGTSP